MNLEQIVPPLEDCQLIPEGSFPDSAFVFVRSNELHDDPELVLRSALNDVDGVYDEIHPAPTLAEIMAEIPGCNCEYDNGVFTVEISVFHTIMKFIDKNPATAALWMWLKIKGKDK